MQFKLSTFTSLVVKSILIVSVWLVGVYVINQVFNQDGSFGSVTASGENVDIWWPTTDVRIDNVQPFKAVLRGKALNEYYMFWQVDGGQYNKMSDSFTDYPHKEARVDLSSWTWRGGGPYKVTFIAQNLKGEHLGDTSVTIYTGETRVQAETVTSSEIPLVVPTETGTISTLAPQSVSAREVNVWWPAQNSVLTGSQPLKAVVSDLSLSDYRMYWQVGSGALNEMNNISGAYPHKETEVSFENWNWKGIGPYEINFVAKQGDTVIAEKKVSVYTGTPSISTAISTQTVETSTPVATAVSQTIQHSAFYINSYSSAKKQADEWRNSRPSDAALMDTLAAQPDPIWFGGWNSNIKEDVRKAVQSAEAQGKATVLVAYNIPQRDCGSYSAGGANGADAYKSWIANFADGLGSGSAYVILEPDALANLDCLSNQDREKRYELVSYAIRTLKAKPNVRVYVDAGHPQWKTSEEIAVRLNKAGISNADGFSLNVSNFFTTEANIQYGESVSRLVGGKRFVIDTSRNGAGTASGNEWCNPQGRALGQRPTTSTGRSLVDAYLWVKKPGESDGSCNGGPSAGQWWGEYALGLVKRSAY